MVSGNEIQLRYAETVGGDYITIEGTTSVSLDIQYSTQEVTKNRTNGWREVIPQQRSVTMSFNGLSTPMDTIEFISIVRTGTIIHFNYGGNGYLRSASGLLTSFNWSGQVDSAMTFSGTIEVDGEFTDIIVEDFILMSEDGLNLTTEAGLNLIGNRQI